MATDSKYKNHAADRSIKEDLSMIPLLTPLTSHETLLLISQKINVLSFVTRTLLIVSDFLTV